MALFFRDYSILMWMLISNSKLYEDSDKPLNEKFFAASDFLFPKAEKLAGFTDPDKDGIDPNTPIKLSIRPDKRVPPMMTFLTAEQVAHYVDEEQDILSGGNNEEDSEEGAEEPAEDESSTEDSGEDTAEVPVEVNPFWEAGGKYIRLGLANLEIAAFKQEYIAPSQGGTRKFCKRLWQDDPSMEDKGFCSMTGTAFYDDNEVLGDDPSCSDGEVIEVPYANGADVAHQPKEGENSRPLYRIRINLLAHLKIAGVNREQSAKELLTNPNAEYKNVVHLQFAPDTSGPAAFIPYVEVIENNTSAKDSQISDHFSSLFGSALGTRCQNLNELRFAIPEKFDFDAEEGSLIDDLGLESFKLGEGSTNLPEVYVDDNRLYLDVLILGEIGWKDDEGSSDDESSSDE